MSNWIKDVCLGFVCACILILAVQCFFVVFGNSIPDLPWSFLLVLFTIIFTYMARQTRARQENA